jgi:hypothetical protein
VGGCLCVCVGGCWCVCVWVWVGVWVYLSVVAGKVAAEMTETHPNHRQV